MARIAVIGGGMAGLAAAAALGARGHAVTLLEARAAVGGKVEAQAAGGAQVDLGPTILTDLEPLQALFAAAGVALESELTLVRPDPALVVTFEEGARFALHVDPERTRSEVARLGPDAAADWARLMALGARAERLAAHFYRRGDVSSLADLMRFALAGGSGLADVLPFARYPSLGRLLSAIVRTEPLRRFLGHFGRFIGQGAETSPSVAVVIPYLMATRGIWYPLGGFSRLAERLSLLAAKAGVAVALGDRVERLDIAGGRVRAAIAASGRRVEAEAFVSATDVGETARWLPGSALERSVRRLRPSMTAHVAWWAMDGPAPVAAHHALHFARRAEEPLYVATPTVTDAALAPAGATVVHALVHGAPGEPATPALAGRLRARVAAAGHWPGGPERASGVSGAGGPCYGYEVGPGLLASFRPSQRAPGLANLALAGGSVFPGPGLANVLRSGLRAARLAEAAARRPPA